MNPAVIQFAVSRHDHADPATDFDLGDIALIVGDFVASSRSSPRYANMIYVTLADLLDGLARMLQGRRRHYELVAADSAFTLTFTVTGPHLVVRHRGQTAAGLSLTMLAHAVQAGVDRFMSERLNILPESGPAAADLASSRQTMRALLAPHAAPPGDNTP